MVESGGSGEAGVGVNEGGRGRQLSGCRKLARIGDVTSTGGRR